MITICLDESGSFEAKNNKKKFVGGVIYTGDDYEDEKVRLEDFFRSQCEKNGMNYPHDIHSTDINLKEDSLKKAILMEFKNKLLKALKDYIRESGKYNFTYTIKSKKNRNDYRNISNVVNDNNASNLYEHMIIQLLDNIMFYNLYFQADKCVTLELSTRVAVVKKWLKEELDEYRKLGFNEKYDNEKSQYRFFLTSQQTFKSAISTKMMESKIKNNIDLNINAKSANYKKSNKDNENKTTAFLYLADLACDIIRDELDENLQDFGIERCNEVLENITGKDNPVIWWAYDDVDGAWNELVTSYYEKDFIKVLNWIYTIEKFDSPFTKHYCNYWVKSVENKLDTVFDKNSMEVYLEQIEYLFAKDRKEDYKRGLFLADRLWNEVIGYEENTKCSIKPASKYYLSDLLIRGHNHNGNISKSKEFYGYCEKFKDSVYIQSYLETFNRVAQINANEFDFQGAIDRMEKKLENSVNVLKEALQVIVKDNNINKESSYCLELRGKFLSTLGQLYAFKRDKAESLRYFQEALNEFKNSPSNLKITTSYILHLALDNMDKELYEIYAKDYFKTLNINDLLAEFIIDDEKKRLNDYNLYIFVKSLNTIYFDNLTEEFGKNLYKVIYKTIKTSGKKHPWELIYKNVSLILYKLGLNQYGRNLGERAVTDINEPGITIELINLMTQIEMNHYENNSIEKENSIKKFKEKINEYEIIKKYFQEVLQAGSLEETFNQLKLKFTYMYA